MIQVTRCSESINTPCLLCDEILELCTAYNSITFSPFQCPYTLCISSFLTLISLSFPYINFESITILTTSIIQIVNLNNLTVVADVQTQTVFGGFKIHQC